MRKRTKQVMFRLGKMTKSILDKKLKQTGLDFSNFMRLLCETIPVKTFPRMDYRKYVLSIRNVGNRINEEILLYHKTKTVFPDRILCAVNELDTLVNECREEIKTMLETHGEVYQTGVKQ